MPRFSDFRHWFCAGRSCRCPDVFLLPDFDAHHRRNARHQGVRGSGFGGIGSIPGAFLGGILLGIIENLSKAYISTQLSDAIVFVVLIVVLIVKPTGLLGKRST